MLRYGSRRIRKHRTMRMPRKMNNKITKTNVVFCSRDMLESDKFPRGTRGEGMGCPPSIVQGIQSTDFSGSSFFHPQFAEIMVAASWRGCVIAVAGPGGLSPTFGASVSSLCQVQLCALDLAGQTLDPFRGENSYR